MRSVDRAIDAMNAPLRREYERIHALLKADPATIEARHSVGTVVVAVKRDPEQYGKQAIALLAAALGRDEATLYRFAQVASRWTAHDLADWIERGRSSDTALSWWHFVEASAVPRKRDRDELLRKAMHDGLSVRALARLAEAAGLSRRTSSHLVRDAEALVQRANALRERWARLRAASLDEVRRTLSPEALDRAFASHEALLREAQRALDDVEALRAAIGPERAPGTVGA